MYLPDQHAALTLLEHSANINSGSLHAEGIARVQALFETEFGKLASSCSKPPLPSQAHYLDDGSLTEIGGSHASLFQIAGNTDLKVLLVGHLDTVFPKGSSFNRCWREGERLRGPGVADMKGGIVSMLWALNRLCADDALPRPDISIVLTPDEEIGSPVSAALLHSLAQQHDVGFVFEPTMEDGALAGERKGSGNFYVEIQGRSTHAGRDFFNGKNAVLAGAKLAAALSELSDEHTGTTLNVARIAGGSAMNVVPDSATLFFNVRVPNSEAQARVTEQIESLVDTLRQTSESAIALKGGFHRPAKPMTATQKKLNDFVAECGAQRGTELCFKATGGCCDGNNLAAAGLPNIDTLGVRGGGIHSDQEYMVIDSLMEKSTLTLDVLTGLAKHSSQWKRRVVAEENHSC